MNKTSHLQQHTQTQLKFRTALLKCARHMSDAYNQLLEPYELNFSLWQVIYLLHEHNPHTSIDLAKSLNVSKPSIAKRVHMLEQLELIEHISTEDRRQKLLKLNKKGQQLFQICSAEIDQYETQLLQTIDTEKLNMSIDVLNNVLAIFKSQKLGVNK